MSRPVLMAAAILAIVLTMCGCRQNTPAGTATPARTPTYPPAGISSYPPDKTASQDTAGADTKLPEAATAANTVDGTLSP